MDLEKLKAPFEANEVEWRIGSSGKNGEKVWAKVLAYVTNRAIMDRLDAVCGPENWRNEFAPTPNDPERKSLLCGISIRVGEEWVTKWDGAGNTDFESIKGGISDSMKRAAVQWGIGRYLYGLDEGWPEIATSKPQNARDWHYAKTKDSGVFWWKPPVLPSWALPANKPASVSAGPPVHQPPAATNGPRPQDAAKARAVAAVKPGALKPASEVNRGDDPDWHQWLTPPAEVAESDDAFPWHIQAWKGLRQHAGATNAATTRALIAHIWFDDESRPQPQDVVADAGVAKKCWQLLLDAHKGGEVPFTRIVSQALAAAREAVTA